MKFVILVSALTVACGGTVEGPSQSHTQTEDDAGTQMETDAAPEADAPLVAFCCTVPFGDAGFVHQSGCKGQPCGPEGASCENMWGVGTVQACR